MGVRSNASTVSNVVSCLLVQDFKRSYFAIKLNMETAPSIRRLKLGHLVKSSSFDDFNFRLSFVVFIRLEQDNLITSRP